MAFCVHNTPALDAGHKARMKFAHINAAGRCHVVVRVSSPAIHEAKLVRSIEIEEHNIRGITMQECRTVDAISQLSGQDVNTSIDLLNLGACFWGDVIKGQNKTKWRRILPCRPSSAVYSETLPADIPIRVHPKPKRYSACHATDWPMHVLHLDDDLLVINKPAGLPCMAHESNGLEEVAGCAGRALGVADGLEVGHRLDQWTTGVLVLTRNKGANRRFKETLQNKDQVIKVYKALTSHPVPLGRLEHWMYDGPFNEEATVLGGASLPPRGPRLLSHTAHPGWRLCSLEVLLCEPCPSAKSWLEKHHVQQPTPSAAVSRWSCQSMNLGSKEMHHSNAASPHEAGTSCSQDALAEVAVDSSAVHGNMSRSGLNKEPNSGVYEVTVRLLTGRTHQIRAQLAAIHCPLLGDTMYGQIPGLLVDKDGVISDPDVVRLASDMPALEGHIGLHAYRMAWDDLDVCAPTPWSMMHTECT